jgi:hypothetical protein
VELAYQVDEMLDTSTEPVQFPNNQGVAVAESFLHFSGLCCKVSVSE